MGRSNAPGDDLRVTAGQLERAWAATRLALRARVG